MIRCCRRRTGRPRPRRSRWTARRRRTARRTRTTRCRSLAPHALLYERYVYHARGTDGVSDVQGPDQPILRQRFRYFRTDTIQVPVLDEEGQPTAQTEPVNVEVECFAPGTAPATPGEPAPPTGYTGYTRIKQETVYYIQSLRGDVVSLISSESAGGAGSATGDEAPTAPGSASASGARVIETVRYTSFGVPRVYRRGLVCDIAHDDGTPLIRGVTRDPSSVNGGVTEGDYNLFFARFFDEVEENRWPCDIAADDGRPLQDGKPVGTGVNNGVTEADYNLFFAEYFNGGTKDQLELGSEWGDLSFPEHNNRIGYAGYWWDERVNMYCVRNRWYTPRTGRWLTPDPIGYAGGRNLYEYCGSRPWEFVDPMGLWGEGIAQRWISSDSWLGIAAGYTLGTVGGAAEGAYNGFMVTSNVMVNTATFGAVGMTRNELDQVGMLTNNIRGLGGSEIAGKVAGASGFAATVLATLGMTGVSAPATYFGAFIEGAFAGSVADIAAQRYEVVNGDRRNYSLIENVVAATTGGTLSTLFRVAQPFVASAIARLFGTSGDEAASATGAGAARVGSPKPDCDKVCGTNSTVTWVDEAAEMSADARRYNSGAEGARSNVVTRQPQASSITGAQRPVRFDGEESGLLIDRKLAVVTSPKA